jgi:hypothetical protein
LQKKQQAYHISTTSIKRCYVNRLRMSRLKYIIGSTKDK